MAPGVMAASQVASGIGMIVGAWVFKALWENDQPKSFVRGGAAPRCATCNGSKRVPCICKRWSDGDQGCSTCDRTGMRTCSSCGGSGTGRPLPVKLRISNGQNKL
ncbi:hypothetical protein SUGI_0267580 [Cryptomeria japonica]|uniref:uncharacterized protein LOC131874644 n=1 Tax=Cryptomeria japonica TaxID=3369 RepID=UPI002408B53B|nr:uncharacterized protein LOC131874644 [Cryptomeria japonica]GLJ16072.1 hypothetical protein SUGI_0267580 [Cryptomeria japonica]